MSGEIHTGKDLHNKANVSTNATKDEADAVSGINYTDNKNAQEKIELKYVKSRTANPNWKLHLDIAGFPFFF